MIYFLKEISSQVTSWKGLLLFMLHLIKVLLPSSKFPPEIKDLTFMRALKEQECVTLILGLKTS